MKKLALTICVILGLAGVALAQQSQEDQFVLTMPITAPCLPSDSAVRSLEKNHGEYPFAQGAGIIWNSRIQEYIGVKVLIFLNPETFSFTVAYEVPGDDLICMVSTGDSFQPIPRGQNL